MSKSLRAVAASLSIVLLLCSLPTHADRRVADYDLVCVEFDDGRVRCLEGEALAAIADGGRVQAVISLLEQSQLLDDHNVLIACAAGGSISRTIELDAVLSVPETYDLSIEALGSQMGNPVYNSCAEFWTAQVGTSFPAIDMTGIGGDSTWRSRVANARRAFEGRLDQCRSSQRHVVTVASGGAPAPAQVAKFIGGFLKDPSSGAAAGWGMVMRSYASAVGDFFATRGQFAEGSRASFGGFDDPIMLNRAEFRRGAVKALEVLRANEPQAYAQRLDELSGFCAAGNAGACQALADLADDAPTDDAPTEDPPDAPDPPPEPPAPDPDPPEAPEPGDAQPAATGLTQCLQDVNCDNCASLSAWWDFFSTRCDQSGWRTPECRSWIENSPFCADPTIAIPAPDGEIDCLSAVDEAPTDTLVERLRCDLIAKFSGVDRSQFSCAGARVDSPVTPEEAWRIRLCLYSDLDPERCALKDGSLTKLQYTTAAGDTLPRLGRHANDGHWIRIFERNLDTLGLDPANVRPGQQLTIPFTSDRFRSQRLAPSRVRRHP